MKLIHLACVATFVLGGAAHVVGIIGLRMRVDALARQGSLAKRGLSFFGTYLVMLRSIDEVLRRTDLAPDKRLRTWASFARTSFYVAMVGGLVGFFIQALS